MPKARDKYTTKTEGNVLIVERLLLIQAILNKLDRELPDDAVRIEVDVEWADGGRVKLEAKA